MDELLIPSERRFYESIQLTSGTEQFWSPGTRVFATLGRYVRISEAWVDNAATQLGF